MLKEVEKYDIIKNIWTSITLPNLLIGKKKFFFY